MTAPLQPVASVLPVSVPTGQAAAQAGNVAAAAVSELPAAQQPPAAQAAPPATSMVQWSPQTLQNLKLQAFEHLIAQLALQVQAQPGAPAASWPSQGLPAAVQQFVQSLLAQVQVSLQGQAQPLQLLAGQQGSVALMQALAQAAVSGAQPHSSALQTAAALSPTAAVALEQAQQGMAAAAGGAAAPRLPQLQNWLVQQGTLVTPQGERSFSLTLQVPAAWAQAVGAASIPTAQGPGTALRLPMADPGVLSSGPLALVVQPQSSVATSTLATSALLWLELQPVTASSAQATPVQMAGLPLAMPAPALAQEVQQLLQNKSDPWLMMAAAQAANALPVPRRSGEHRSHLCMTEGCQYQGLAPCAQPFCSEMNRIWAASGVARSG
ncbi:Fe-S oxidoreductase [Comamonas thiooxydans]|uniref:Fe-S oxidoreductase n=1 Tax=Comamonas thiooxydans TaxID=363952 RepID=UPI001CCDEF5A|nr:Fe-S oxidoreductase [Comamonas thiooxydans]UBQ42124.1 Fe-S oxidoreductase [Comamonas thiooxydans]